MRRSTSGTLGACSGSACGSPVSHHGLQAERRVAEGPRLHCSRRTLTASCVCGIYKWREGRETLVSGPVPCSALWGPHAAGSRECPCVQGSPGPLLLPLWAHPPLHPARLVARVYRCHESHALRQRVGVPVSRNIPSAG